MDLPVCERGLLDKEYCPLHSQVQGLYFCQPHPAMDLVNKKLKKIFFFFTFHPPLLSPEFVI